MLEDLRPALPVWYETHFQFPLQAADLLLSELCASLDEDMAGLDEYERGVRNPAGGATGATLQAEFT